VLELAQDADILIADAQYTADEYEGRCGPCRKGWGHNAIHHATSLAHAAHVKTLVLFHHDPSHDDVVVQELEQMAQRDFSHARAAREGLKLEL